MRSPNPRHEYELFVELALEDYKDSISRPELLKIGDEAIAALRGQAATLTESALWEEIDRIVARRLRLPSFTEWRERNRLGEKRTSALVDAQGRSVSTGADARPVLVTAESISEELIRALNRDPVGLFSLSPRKFEELIAELLAREGFDVEVTPATRDGGKDVIARMHTVAGSFVVYVECKRYAAERPVGVSIARELIGVLHTERATSGLLITTSSFSSGVHRLRNTIPHRLDLKAYEDLVAWLHRAHELPRRHPHADG